MLLVSAVCTFSAVQTAHLQAFFIDADHHPRVLTLHAEADTQDALMLVGFPARPGRVVGKGGQRKGPTVGRRQVEGEGQTGAPGCSSGSWMGTGVAQDGELWRQHALQRIHHIWKAHIVGTS